jgi:Flp pilus assembly pilin Flp
MREVRTVGDWVLYSQVAAMTRIKEAGRALQRRVADEKGQTPTEYLMIVGLMAAVIVLVFVTFYWDQVKAASKEWVQKVKESITGSKIK